MFTRTTLLIFCMNKLSDVYQIFCLQGGVASPEEEEDNVQVSKIFEIAINNSINIAINSSINIVINSSINIVIAINSSSNVVINSIINIVISSSSTSIIIARINQKPSANLSSSSSSLS